MAGIFHKWVNDAEIHDSLSLYSFSWLRGGGVNNNNLDFPKGGYWFISIYDSETLMKIIKQIQINPNIAYGMTVKEVVIFETPEFSSEQRFMLATPIFIKRTMDKKSIHYLYFDNESDKLMTETLKTKLKKAGINDESLKISFDRSYDKAKVKLISYKGIKNKANLCPVIITGKPETLAFAWNVGIGNSTGIGFGALL
ncbi:CRISPR-associated endoribonuclease Cas6 [Chloroherpeton thalassium]|uniref:CRISPR-associated endoribonuclease Cas6 n=1 Tax=Chloroherpeton thalassium TaxID=100716 RepID=UPI001B7FB7EF|nr:CRISPR-associated endoribonuclease Cas6 [Chloroherpeton thalassium]